MGEELKYRTYEIQIDSRSIKNNDDTIPCVLSTDSPVEMYPGYVEMLDHSPGAVDLSRASRSLSLLLEHTPGEQIGALFNVRTDGNKIRADMKPGAGQKAQEIFSDIKNGIRGFLSIGYKILKSVQEKNYTRVTKWALLEASVVSIPADPAAGAYRSRDKNNSKIGGIKMDRHSEVPSTWDGTAEEWAKHRNKDEYLERERISEIRALRRGHKVFGEDEEDKFINEGYSIDQVRTVCLGRMGKRRHIETVDPSSAMIGLYGQDLQRCSIVGAIRAQLPNADPNERDRFREYSNAVAQRMGKKPQGLFIPLDVMTRSGLVKGTPSAGGDLIATEILAANFVDVLRNKSMVILLGATRLPGLVGDIAIPRKTAGATSYWVTEGNAPTEGAIAFDQIAMLPHTVGAWVQISRKIVLQSSVGIEQMVTTDLAGGIAVEIDRVAINGVSGSDEPEGILNVSGIGSVVGGENGAAPTLSHLIDLESAVAIDNADVGALAYLTNAKVRGKLKKTFANATYGETPVYGEGRLDGEGRCNGYRAVVSNNVPSNLTKGGASGVCSGIIFGNFADLIIAEWGALDILVDPYSLMTSGGLKVRALMDVDVAVRHAESFAAMKDALTS